MASVAASTRSKVGGRKKFKLLIVLGPSASGKTELVHDLMDESKDEIYDVRTEEPRPKDAIWAYRDEGWERGVRNCPSIVFGLTGVVPATSERTSIFYELMDAVTGVKGPAYGTLTTNLPLPKPLSRALVHVGALLDIKCISMEHLDSKADQEAQKAYALGVARLFFAGESNGPGL